MGYRIEFKELSNYLHVLVEGQESYENSVEYTQAIIKYCEKTGYRNILIEENFEGELSIFDIYKISTYLIKILFSKNLMLNVAYLDKTQIQDRKSYFGENVFVNRGLNIKFFSVYDEAKKWLLNQ